MSCLFPIGVCVTSVPWPPENVFSPYSEPSGRGGGTGVSAAAAPQALLARQIIKMTGSRLRQACSNVMISPT